MDTTKDTTMQHVTDVAIVPEATTEFIAGLLERIERLESDLATAEQDSRQKQARIERLEEEECKQAALLDCLNEWKALAKSAEKERDALRAALTDLLNDLEERAPLNIEKSPRVVACGNSVYVQAKAALEATP